MSTGLIFRAAGTGGLQRAGKELGPGLWSLPASSPGRPGALLHPIPPWLPERTGLRVDLHIMVSWPVSSMFEWMTYLFIFKNGTIRINDHLHVNMWDYSQVANFHFLAHDCTAWCLEYKGEQSGGHLQCFHSYYNFFYCKQNCALSNLRIDLTVYQWIMIQTTQ